MFKTSIGRHISRDRLCSKGTEIPSVYSWQGAWLPLELIGVNYYLLAEVAVDFGHSGYSSALCGWMQ